MLAYFKESLTELNDILYFDQHQFLREKCSNPAKLRHYIVEATKLLTTSKYGEDRYFLCGTLGNLYRIDGNPEKALFYLTFCLEYAQTNQQASKEIATLIRIGEALKYDQNHRETLVKFDRALEKCNGQNETGYIDFVQQHKGKCLMELSRLDEAETCLLQAMELRKAKGNLELLESTQKALEMVRTLRNT